VAGPAGSVADVADAQGREAIVNEHMRLENGHDFPACIDTFHHARYEVLPSAEVFDGPEAVGGFLETNRKAFPDFVFSPTRVMGGPDAVLVEGRFVGTHLGTWRGLLATGRQVDFPMALVFEFDDDKMVNERVYFDLNSPLQQLGVGDDPNGLRFKLTLGLTHPFAIFKTILRKLSPFKKRPPKRKLSAAS
jgi:predicted ester cyclase